MFAARAIQGIDPANEGRRTAVSIDLLHCRMQVIPMYLKGGKDMNATKT